MPQAMSVPIPLDPTGSTNLPAPVPVDDLPTALAWWEAAFEYCSIGVAILDGESGQVLLTNQSFAFLVGRAADDLAGMDPATLVAPEDRGRFWADLQRARRGEAHEAGAESRWLRPDGSVVWMLLSFDVVRAPVEAPPRILLHARDLSDRRRAEAALLASNEQLAEAQRLAHVGSFEWDMASDAMVCSSELARIFGLPAGPDPSDSEWFFERVHPDDRAAVIDAFDTALESETAVIEHRVLLASGQVRWVRTSCRAVADDRSGAVRLVGTSQDVTMSRAALEQLEHTALHDPLTGLANRALFTDRTTHAMVRARRQPLPLSVLYVDVDDFKQANDTFGHVAGDLVLQGVATRLQACVRPGDTIARLGGDEFAILLEDAGEDTARAVAERILEQLRQPFPALGSLVTVSTSVGIGVAGPGDGVEELLVAADTALYAAKGAGKDRFRVFEPRLRAALRERSTLRSDLASALDRGEMEVFYQPIVALSDGTVVAMEALLRWQHPRRGLLLPAEFLSLAEESGLIVALGRWALGQACAQAAGWRSTHAGLAQLRVSVNLSERQLQDPELPDHVAAAMNDAELPAGALTLELSERAVADPDAVLATVDRLTGLGARVALDDFGAFSSSLPFLRRFPPGELKLDRSLVAGLDGTSGATEMVGALIDLGHALRLDTVAEGVERPDQLAQLSGLGCDLAQGLYWAGPGRAEEVERWLATREEPLTAPSKK